MDDLPNNLTAAQAASLITIRSQFHTHAEKGLVQGRAARVQTCPEAPWSDATDGSYYSGLGRVKRAIRPAH